MDLSAEARVVQERFAAWPGPVIRHEWKMMASLRVKDPSITKTALAQLLGYNLQTIIAWTRHPLYQAYENYVLRGIEADLTPAEVEKKKSILEQVQENWGYHALDMQNRLLDLIDTVDDPRLQKEIASDWLDRAGQGAPKANKTSGLTVTIGADVLQQFLTVAREAGVLAVPVKGDVSAAHPEEGELR